MENTGFVDSQENLKFVNDNYDIDGVSADDSLIAMMDQFSS